jgi:hypothetical protein
MTTPFSIATAPRTWRCPTCGLLDATREALSWALDILVMYRATTGLPHGVRSAELYDAAMVKARGALEAPSNDLDSVALSEAWRRHRDAYWKLGSLNWHSCGPQCSGEIIDTIRLLRTPAGEGGER